MKKPVVSQKLVLFRITGSLKVAGQYAYVNIIMGKSMKYMFKKGSYP